MDECQVLGVCFGCESHDILQGSIHTRVGHIFGAEPLLEVSILPHFRPPKPLPLGLGTLPCLVPVLGIFWFFPEPFCLQV